MSGLIKVGIVKEFWYEGRHYIKGECLYFTQEVINNIGSEYFEIIKSLERPTKDKMIRSPSYSK